MKKKLLSLILCLVLVCTSFAACGKKEESTGTDNKEGTEATVTKGADENDEKPTPTEAPKDMVAEKIKEYSDNVLAVLEELDNLPMTESTGVGAEINMELAIGAMLAESYGLTGLETVGLIYGGNFKDMLMDMDATLTLNGDSVLDMDMYLDNDALYINLPKYSDNYMKMDMEELLGISLDDFMAEMEQEMEASTEGMPNIADWKKLWENFSEQFLAALSFEGMTAGESITQGDYTVKGNKYTNTVDMEKMEAAMNTLIEEMAKFPALEITATEMELNEDTKVYIHYYEGENGTYALEMETVDDSKQSAVIMNAEKGYCVYTVMEDTAEVAFYTVRESDAKGNIVIINSDGTELVIAYDNFSENGVDLEMDIDGMKMSFGFQLKGDTVYIDFEMPEVGIKLSAVCESDDTNTKVTMTVSYQDIEFGTLTIEGKERPYEEVSVPTNVVDQETWSTGMDVLALAGDLQQLMEDYPFLANLLGGGNVPDDDAEDLEDWGDISSDDETVSGEIPEGYTDDFMGFTGYVVGEDNYVDFEPLLEEVLAVGQPSTGIDTVPVTEEQKADLLAYVQGAFAENYPSETVSYNIFGSVEYGTVESYYMEDYLYYDEKDFNNSLEVVFDAISGELGRISVRNVDKAEAIRMANELFKIAGIDFIVTEENVEEYNEVGDVAISGYEGSSSYSISMGVYRD